MKKRGLLAFVVLLILCACSENKETVSDGVGSLYIVSTVDISTTRADTRANADVNEFTLMLENTSTPGVSIAGVFSEFPNGTIDNIPVGNYKLTLTSHPEGFTPAFEDPWYEGVKTPVPVASGVTTMVSVECIQANAGVSFIYDPTLEQAGLGAIVPEMTQDGKTLYFDGKNRNAKAYFNPKPVELRIKLGDEYLSIGGKTTQTLDLSKEQLWETTLKPSHITGKMSIMAKVKVITEPTNFVEFELGEVDPIEVTGVEINGYTASFLAKGSDISAMRYGLYPKSTLDFQLGLGFSPEDVLNRDGNLLEAHYLSQLNKPEGLLMSFDGMFPEIEYSLLIMSTQNDMMKVQRYNFMSAQGITADLVQDPEGPIVPGTYAFNIYQDMVDGEYVEPYENQIVIVKAVQEDTYIVKNLFMCDFELVAKYNKSTGLLTFTGKDVREYDIFNDVILIIGDGDFIAGIYLTDGEKQVDNLVFTVEDRKLAKTATTMQFRTFDGLTEQDMGWLEISPLHNPFTYVSSSTEIVWDPMSSASNRAVGYSNKLTRAGSTRANGKVELRSSVIELK